MKEGKQGESDKQIEILKTPMPIKALLLCLSIYSLWEVSTLTYKLMTPKSQFSVQISLLNSRPTSPAGYWQSNCNYFWRKCMCGVRGAVI